MTARKTLSKADYGRHRGCHPNEITDALRAGRIVAERDGTINVRKADASWAASVNPASAAKPKNANGGSILSPASASAIEAARDVLVAAGFAVSGAIKMSFVEARTSNEVTKSLINQLRLRERQGELVDRSKAVDAIFGLARMERDAWAAWPARVAAILAAEFQVDPHKLELALDKMVREHLRSLGNVDVDSAISSARRAMPGVAK